MVLWAAEGTHGDHIEGGVGRESGDVGGEVVPGLSGVEGERDVDVGDVGWARSRCKSRGCAVGFGGFLTRCIA